jgi:hypothetical protein
VDALGYHTLAVNWLAGRGFTLAAEPPYVPDAIRTPVYPAWLASLYAAAGPNPLWLALAQGALDALTTVVLADAAWRVTGRRRAGLAAGALYALNPTAWRLSNELLTEILLAHGLAWLVWVWLHWRDRPAARWLAVLGGLAGLAALTKPNVVLLPLLVGACVAVRRRPKGSGWRGVAAGAGRGLMVLAVAGAVLVPWLARNRLVFGRWFFSHAFDNNLARVSAVATLARLNGERVAPWTPRWEALYSGLLLEAQARFGPAFTPVLASAGQADRTQRQLAAVAADVVGQHPAEYALAHLEGFARSWVPQEHRFWYGVLAGQSWDSLGSAEGVLGQALAAGRAWGPWAALRFVWQARFASLPPLALALWLGWLLAYAVSGLLLAVGTWRLRHQPALLGLLWGTILYSTFLPGPIAHVRFRVPVAPALILVMAAGWLSDARRPAREEAHAPQLV